LTSRKLGETGIFDDLFLMGDPLANRPFRGNVDCSIEDAIAFSRGEQLPRSPVEVTWDMGSGVPSDVIWTVSALPLVVSARFIELLKDAGLTGWHTYAVRVTAKNGTEMSGFHGLAITGRCDPPDLSRSELALREYPGGWFPVLRGRFFKETSGDSSDLFMERPDERGKRTLNRYVTGRLVRAVRRSRIGNLRLEKLSELEVGGSVYEISSRYRLPHDYEERVAALRARTPSS
jgi:hypothetical protein